jgi:2-oxoglutarate dehydrogenase E2 component (dihydrolipoamide succinyltransferase)
VKEEPAHASNGSPNGVGQRAQEQEEEVFAGATETATIPTTGASGRFYSPLVKNIAKQENIAPAELEKVTGTGMHGRVTKKDILAYVENRQAAPPRQPQP